MEVVFTFLFCLITLNIACIILNVFGIFHMVACMAVVKFGGNAAVKC